ncbi:AbfB domain-containing protein [Streptomyces sp. TRM68416]|uniref:AbfB domain-containing protein n=1 Tax=Streptomyces sp. TRM68416 TaxID=2758412 RepID=UPI002948BC35|nr:AbfB domain-containing protein [Streptomyces sp. TRM68416]
MAASPRCPELTATLTSWDGRPSALWRTRLARHVRDCPRCLLSGSDLIPAEGLLGGLALVPVPIGLAGLVPHTALEHGSTGTAAGAGAHAAGGTGRVTRVVGRLAAKPVAAVTTGAVALTTAGVAWYAVTPSPTPEAAPRPSASVPLSSAAPSASPTPSESVAASQPASPTASASPTPKTAARLSGPHALRSFDAPSHYVRQSDDFGVLAPVGASGSAATRQTTTFTFVPGLADSDCYSLKDAAGRYLRHYAFRVRLDTDDGSALFQKDATFCPRPGAGSGSLSLESYNYPGRYLRHRDDLQLWLDTSENTAAYRASRSFLVVAPQV